MTNFDIKERRVTNVTILELTGEMGSGESSNLFCSTIHRLLEEGQREILLNLAGVTSFDSSGLGDLIASRNTLDKCGGQVKLLNLSKPVRELMTLSKLLTDFETYDNETDALDGFKGSTLQLKREIPSAGEEHPVISFALRQKFEAINGRMNRPMTNVIRNVTSRLWM